MQDFIPEFLALNHYLIAKQDDAASVYFKTILASASMPTPFGTFVVTMRPTELLVHHDRGDDSYRFGIRQGKQTEISAAFPEEEFKIKLAEFETKLNG